MVSTRRSGSLSGNNSKRSSSSEDKPPSPKRQKVENGGAAENTVPATENYKEACTPVAADPGECGTDDSPIAGNSVSGGKTGATPAVAVAAAITEGSTPVVMEKPRSSFSSWSLYQKQNLNFETSTPWCRLLSQSGQNANVSICTSNFSIGSSRHCNFPLKDQAISANLCKIKHAQSEGSAVVVLEITGSKGSVQVNGRFLKKNTSCELKSGDEVVFGSLGNHAYVSFPA